ncbi:MAG: NTP transferase domain-containing protein [bacterium]
MHDANDNRKEIRRYLDTMSSPFGATTEPLAIILAAGHGKRIKSATSKMLHEIWGEPTVVRVSNAARDGLQAANQVIVVGIKAREVAETVGRRDHLVFAYQAQQNGTGHAVRVALEQIPDHDALGDIYIFPGDMGLIDAETTRMFKQAFLSSGCDMMVLTGLFDGDASSNTYGRILRVPAVDVDGTCSGPDQGKVIEIKEHKDILALADDELYRVRYRSRTYSFSKQSLIENQEFNTGVFAFKADRLKEHIGQLNTDNVQGELYLTDLIGMFNASQLSVGAIAAADNRAVVGFNTKSVLREMNDIAREKVYRQLKDLVAFEDRNDFFLADDIVEQIIRFDTEQGPLDLTIGKGAFLETGLTLNRGVKIGRGARLSGVVELGENCRIGDGVTITGTEEFPTKLGRNVTITGSSNISGCTIEDDVLVEHTILEHKTIKRIRGRDGKVQPVRFVRPQSEGLSAINSL